MLNGAYAHDLQVLNACVTPGCYNFHLLLVEYLEQFQQKTLNPTQVDGLCKDEIVQYSLAMAPRTVVAES
jgi:hypothetical protein